MCRFDIEERSPELLPSHDCSNFVVAPQRDSSTHHTPLHHSKVHPPHAAGWRFLLDSSKYLTNEKRKRKRKRGAFVSASRLCPPPFSCACSCDLSIGFFFCLLHLRAQAPLRSSILKEPFFLRLESFLWWLVDR